MEPRIQYAQTADGVNIAFWTLGEGMPLVQMPTLSNSHIQLEWQLPEYRRWYERLAQKRMLVRYDCRGSGLSDRDVTDYSLEAHVLDLEAVVERLGLDGFALLAGLHSGAAAITYATRHPERVSHLLLWCTYARASDYLRSSSQLEAIRGLIDKDWEVYTETVAHVAFGWSAGEEARRFAAFLRECTTREANRAALSAANDFDVAALLPQVRSPTLVLHRRQVPYPGVGLARDLAAQIRDARLAVLEGTTIAPWSGDTEAVLNAIDEFLSEGEEAPAGPAPSGLVTILFTDMEGSAALRQRLGDARAQELVRTHNSIVREALTAHEGREIKHTGDGIMSSFSTASGALECATAIQRGIAAHVQEHPEAPLGVYIGVNAGEPIAEDKDLFGTSVDLAKRICDHAQPGQILVSDVVRQLAAGKSFLFADCGETEMRGFEDPVRLYEVRWRA